MVRTAEQFTSIRAKSHYVEMAVSRESTDRVTRAYRAKMPILICQLTFALLLRCLTSDRGAAYKWLQK